MSVEKALYYICLAVFIISGILLTVHYFIEKNRGQMIMGFLTPAFALVLIPINYYKLYPTYRLLAIFFIFFILSYNIGIVFEGYHKFKYYDKFVHFLSGFLTTVIGMCIYYYLVKFEEKYWHAAILFALFFSVTVGVIWEVLEYMVYIFTGDDPQNTLTTGVNDTMQDLLLCVTSSSITSLVYFLYYAKGIKIFNYPIIKEFCELNKK